MKKYTWNLVSLKSRKKELLNSLKDNNITELEKDKINFDIDNIDSMLENFSLSKVTQKYPYILKTKNQINEYISYLFNKQLSTFQKQTINETSKFLLDFETKQIDDSIFQNKKIPLENQVDIIMKHFSFNGTLLTENKHLFNPNNRRLHIFSTREINNFCCFDNTGYIANKNNESIESFNSLCHELGHDHELVLTDNRIDYLYHINNKDQLLLYREIYSIFYELLSSYFLLKEKIITENEKIAIHNNIFQDNMDGIYNFVLANIMNIEKNMTIKELLVLKNLNVQLDDIALYFYSYLIAVNLFEQFLIDEEKTLYNLNYLIKNITPENEEQILKFIDADPNDLTKIIKHTNTFMQKKRNN